MRVWNSIEDFGAQPGSAVATIGNFDGVHLGHQAILARVVAAAASDRHALLITFDPHPLAVVAPERRPKQLQTRRQKLDALEARGLSDVLIVPFTPAVAALSGERFFEELLGPHVRLTALYVGEDFRFGRERQGDLELLRRLGGRRGFAAHVVPPVIVDGQPVSSSAIRAAALAGDVERARRLLGYPFTLAGEVVRGEGRGRTLQFPTANIAVENELVPRAGVYITETRVLAARWPSVTNVGFRPTFGGGRFSVEAHLLDFDGDLYREQAELSFLARLRDERRFPSAHELADQIARDRSAAESYFSNVQLRSR
ncbi:MAG TPA: bifunctional riboflavin kinase/FAD synthetase [Candidatus Polarisedimenticolaceae bacterium]|nr:bifunctional riboflavin kinase/FAD synthetase [Candidatus Polarisedimenticolaceae bacterium]